MSMLSVSKVALCSQQGGEVGRHVSCHGPVPHVAPRGPPSPSHAPCQPHQPICTPLLFPRSLTSRRSGAASSSGAWAGHTWRTHRSRPRPGNRRCPGMTPRGPPHRGRVGSLRGACGSCMVNMLLGWVRSTHASQWHIVLTSAWGAWRVAWGHRACVCSRCMRMMTGSILQGPRA